MLLALLYWLVSFWISFWISLVLWFAILESTPIMLFKFMTWFLTILLRVVTKPLRLFIKLTRIVINRPCQQCKYTIDVGKSEAAAISNGIKICSMKAQSAFACKLTDDPNSGNNSNVKSPISVAKDVNPTITKQEAAFEDDKTNEGDRENPAPENQSSVKEDANTTVIKEESAVKEEADSVKEEEEGNEHPRCDWKTIDAIPASKYEKLVSHICQFGFGLREARRLAYKRGLFNAASFVGLRTGNEIDVYIVRVPGHATVEHWTEQDAYMMRREVELIEYIGTNTSAPVPQVCAFSTGFNNMLGHPYIMMTRLPGDSAYSIWYDDDFDRENGFRDGEMSSSIVEKKRITFLRSLAGFMAEINSLSFDQIGMPVIPQDCPEICVGTTFQWDSSGSDDHIEIWPVPTTQEYVSERPDMTSAIHSDNPDMQRGALVLLDIIFNCRVFAHDGEQETFTIHHSDLDLQNILVDSTGAVTGIIDWDRSIAASRLVGAASAPLFLQKDWMPRYLSHLNNNPHMAFSTHRYRHIYAAALTEHGCADAQYTTKSAMYQAGIMALHDDGGDVLNFLCKVLRAIPEFRADVEECLIALGKGWPVGERILKREIELLFEPEMPDVKILEEAENEIVVAEWMVDFKYEVDEV